ncbi:MAG: hypothetical protein M8353_03245 [ANME-2 cluster archaeon]|nr:hypothetical protein [ANME-2 cluster archaeon]
MYEETVQAQPVTVNWKDRLHGMAPGRNFLHFPGAWPGTHDWAAGKYFEVISSVLVTYARSFVIPGSDYKDIDLSNATAGMKLYPDDKGQVHEILVGLKPGDYTVIPYIPSGKYLATLPDSTMVPDVSSATLKYLNAKKPEDSPAENPTMKLWSLKDMQAWVLRLLALEGTDYEKITLEFKINRLRLREIKKPNVYTTIPWHEELRW